MIDICTETLLPLSEVPRRLPSSRAGKRLALTTIYRWAAKGVLDTVRIGGGLFTSVEALQRMGRPGRRESSPPADADPRASPRSRAAAQELARLLARPTPRASAPRARTAQTIKTA